MMKEFRAPVAVLGAGLAGSATALELAKRGVRVALIDQDEIAVNRASLRNEGKIHLGFIYAKDSSLGTARMQLQGALSFRRLLSRWIGAAADRLRRSTPFVYAVASNSLLSPQELSTHYDAVERLYRQALADDPSSDYLGTRPENLVRECPRDLFAAFFRTDSFSAAFLTAELAIDTLELAQHLRRSIGSQPNIRFFPGHRVCAVERRGNGLVVGGSGSEGAWQLYADHVVNALWEGRLLIDRTFGLDPVPGWLHRLKYRVIARLPARLRGAPSATMVLGPYGDIVIRPDATAYLSWYPRGLRGWTHDLVPPQSWTSACRGEVAPAEAEAIAQELRQGLDAWYPGIAEAYPLLVDAGAIVAYGNSDVDDVTSDLHKRSRIGVTSLDNYHSLEPGKLTTAPLFAMEAATRVAKALAPMRDSPRIDIMAHRVSDDR